MFESIKVTSRVRQEMIDVTLDVSKAVKASGVAEGIVVLYVPHTTAAITVNEGADPDVCADLNAGLSKIAPSNANYLHSEGNSDSHIKTSLVSPSIALIIRKGSIVLGTWQKIFFCEFDGPRSRTLHIKIIAG